jgi:hypothetical protein
MPAASRSPQSRPAALLDEAEAFIRAFCAENPAAGPPGPRIRDVRDQVTAGGTYAHTPRGAGLGGPDGVAARRAMLGPGQVAHPEAAGPAARQLARRRRPSRELCEGSTMNIRPVLAASAITGASLVVGAAPAFADGPPVPAGCRT